MTSQQSPEIEALFDEFKNFKTSNQYEETLSCVSAEMSAPEISSSPSDSSSSEASLLPASSGFGELQQLLAASVLITTLEKICAAGVLSPDQEMAVRAMVIRAARAFRFQTQAERGAA